MKTISPPILPKPEDRVYRIPCDNKECAALMEMGHKELTHTSAQRDGDFWQFECPHCRKTTTVYDLKKYLVKTGVQPRDSSGYWTDH
jgi:hypothetical protein